jgi:hypothetical protein
MSGPMPCALTKAGSRQSVSSRGVRGRGMVVMMLSRVQFPRAEGIGSMLVGGER